MPTGYAKLARSRSSWSVTASGTWPGFSTASAIDGNTGTTWHSNAVAYPHTLIVDRGGDSRGFDTLYYQPRSDNDSNPNSFEIYVSDDGSTWGSAIVSSTMANNATQKTVSLGSTYTKRFIKFVGVTGHQSYMSCCEISVNGADWSATADSGTPANAIDNNIGTVWTSGSGYPHHIDLDLQQALSFNTLIFVPHSSGHPNAVEVYVSSDGATWGSPVATDSWTDDNTVKILALGSQSYRYVRLTGTSGYDTAMYCQEIFLATSVVIDGLDVAPHDLTSDTSHAPFVVSYSSQLGSPWAIWKCFDGLNNQGLIGGPTGYIELDIGSGNDTYLAGYGIKVTDEFTRAPRTWTLEGSADELSWDVLDTVAGGNWIYSETQYFACDVIDTAYRYFRLNVTAMNSAGDYVRVDEMYFYGLDSIGPALAIVVHHLRQQGIM